MNETGRSELSKLWKNKVRHTCIIASVSLKELTESGDIAINNCEASLTMSPFIEATDGMIM